jgi:hypothetical protein
VECFIYLSNFANCYQNDPKKARKEAKEGRKGKESNQIEKKKEIVQKYGVSGKLRTLYYHF